MSSVYDFSTFHPGWTSGGRSTQAVYPHGYSCCKVWTPKSGVVEGAPDGYHPMESSSCLFPDRTQIRIVDERVGVQSLVRHYIFTVYLPDSVVDSMDREDADALLGMTTHLGFIGSMSDWSDRFAIESVLLPASDQEEECTVEYGDSVMGLVLYDMWGHAYFHYFHNMFFRAWGTLRSAGLITCDAHAPCVVDRDNIVLIFPSFPHGADHVAIDSLAKTLSSPPVLYEPTEIHNACFHSILVGATSEMDMNAFVLPTTPTLVAEFEQWWNSANGVATPRLPSSLAESLETRSPTRDRLLRFSRPVLTIITRIISHGRKWGGGLTSKMVAWAEERNLIVQVVALEELSFADTMAVFRNSSIVFGVSGAGFTHQYHLYPGSVSVLIYPLNAFHHPFSDVDEFPRFAASRESWLIKYPESRTRDKADFVLLDRPVFDALLDQALALGIHTTYTDVSWLPSPSYPAHPLHTTIHPPITPTDRDIRVS